MAELLFLVSMFLPPIAIVAGVFLLVAGHGPRPQTSGAAAHQEATAA